MSKHQRHKQLNLFKAGRSSQDLKIEIWSSCSDSKKFLEIFRCLKGHQHSHFLNTNHDYFKTIPKQSHRNENCTEFMQHNRYYGLAERTLHTSSNSSSSITATQTTPTPSTSTLLPHAAKALPERREKPSSPQDLFSFPGLLHYSQTDANSPALPFEVALKTFGSGTQWGMSKIVFPR